MSARISIPNKESYISHRVRICTSISDPPTLNDKSYHKLYMYLESYWYHDYILRVKIGIKSSPSYIIPQEIPIFTVQERSFLFNYRGDVIIVSENLDYVSNIILSRFSDHLNNIVVGEDYLAASIKYKYNLCFFGMTGHHTKITELTPDLYLGKSSYNEIIISTGEDICNLDLTSTLIIDVGDYSKAFGFNTWYGVIIKQIRRCKAVSSNTTVVAYGDIDENYVYLYDNEEIKDPSLALPRYFLYSKPFSGRKKLEICVEPINS